MALVSLNFKMDLQHQKTKVFKDNFVIDRFRQKLNQFISKVCTINAPNTKALGQSILAES